MSKSTSEPQLHVLLNSSSFRSNSLKKEKKFGLQPKNKLLDAKQFKQVFDTVHFKVHQASFTLLVNLPDALTTEQIIRQQSIDTARLGIVVAKKKIKRAHERNRVKRLVRDSFRLAKPDLPLVDMVFMIKSEAQHLDNQSIHAQLQLAWKEVSRKYKQYLQKNSQ